MDSLPVNPTDIVVFAVILLSAVFAFVRGFVHEVLAVAAWLGAAIVTLIAFPFALPFVREHITIPLVAEIATGAALFLVVLILLSILTHWISSKVQSSSLGALDRSLGLVFGLARGAVLVCLAWIFLIYILPRDDHPKWIKEAQSLPLVERGAVFFLSQVPDSMMPEGLGTVLPGADGNSATSFDNLLSPPPKGAAQETTSGYNDGDRKEMNRLIEAEN